jgi:hypothetical protein
MTLILLLINTIVNYQCQYRIDTWGKHYYCTNYTIENNCVKFIDCDTEQLIVICDKCVINKVE